ncbi:MAG TPA: acyl-CoA dehydrogenase family protein [Actinomycetota bacterium]|nr:acyl-CoA dehydrogenase family protein [Actinomycetota bacterium]
MDFAFSDEQEMLRTSAREFLADRYPPERIAEIADGEGFDPAEWKAVVEMGWVGISIPEDQGGGGLTFLDEIVLVEEMGRRLYPGPYFSTVVLGLSSLAGTGASDAIASLVSGDRIATVGWAGPDGRFDVDPSPKIEWDGGRLTGTKLFVPDLRAADRVIVLGHHDDADAVWLVDRDQDDVSWRELPTIDGTRRMGELVLDGTAASEPVEAPALATVRDRALTALAVEAVGVGSAALDMAVEHVKERHQFGRPIGSFQAVSHQLADSFVELETARSLAYWAGWAVSEGAPEAPTAAAAAKSRAAEAATAACERAIQVHGGIGFTWEHPLHRWYKRALGIGAYLGWAPEHRARIAAELLD